MELSKENDQEYCNSLIRALKTEIFETLMPFEDKIDHEVYNKISQLCNRVLEGEEFDDAKLNDIFAKLNENAYNTNYRM
ncbi:hypothetical protein lbkm_1856 [Lachnospiraceae bacterium KM106-2]|nr:hypothetical protein lbkm_1856 [Lachnospiraceae bacterium KM106-2]